MESQMELSLIGHDVRDDDAFDLAPIPDLPVRPIHQVLHVQNKDWEAGERVGELFGCAVRAGGDRAICILDFRLDSGDSLVATGMLDAEHAWEGVRSIAITGGTGEYVRAAGVVTVETRNPKRYGISFNPGG